MSDPIGRILDGAIAALREFVLPHLTGDFDRGQVLSVMAMLSELALRADWSRDWLFEQVHDQIATFARIEPLLSGSPLQESRPPFTAVGAELSPRQIETLRDEGDSYLCKLLDEIAEHAADPMVRAKQLRAIILQCLKRQCECELRLTPISVRSAR